MYTIYMAMDRIRDNIMRTLDNEICISVIERLKMSVDNVRVKVLCQDCMAFLQSSRMIELLSYYLTS